MISIKISAYFHLCYILDDKPKKLYTLKSCNYFYSWYDKLYRLWGLQDSEEKRDDIFIVNYKWLMQWHIFHQWLGTYLMMHIFILQTENLRNVDFISLYFFWGRVLYAKLKKDLITFIISTFSSNMYSDRITKSTLILIVSKITVTYINMDD